MYPTMGSQNALDRALSVRAGKAELLHAYIDVEPAGFNRGYYNVDIRYFYRITADAFVGAARPVEITGLAVFDKRVILYGSEGNAKIFTSCGALGETANPCAGNSNLPVAEVEVVDPLVLGMKLVDPCGHCDCCERENELSDIPVSINDSFGGDLSFGNDRKRLYVTLGQFSIVRLERDTQLLIPVYDYCMPTKECTAGSSDGGGDEDPCEIFRQVRFPVDAFFPPNAGGEEDRNRPNCCNCC